MVNVGNQNKFLIHVIISVKLFKLESIITFILYLFITKDVCFSNKKLK